MSADTQACLLAKVRPIVEAKGALAVARRPEVDLNECAACEGQAHMPFWENGYRYMKPCPGAFLDRRIELFERAKLPARYADATLASFVPREPGHPPLLEGLSNYLAGFLPGQSGRLFAGPVGTGKTHLLVAVVRRLTLEKGIPARYVEFSHLLASLRELYGQGRSEAEILGPLTSIPVLAIDELGKGRSNDFELRIIDELISRRYNDASLTTFFATNYFPRAMVKGATREGRDGDFRRHNDGGARRTDRREFLADRIGERTESRIYEMCEFVPLTGEDYRVHLYRGGR